MKRFLREVTKTEESIAIYGEPQVRKALSMGAVDVLLLSEDVRKYRVMLKCSSCEYSEERTVNEYDEETFEPPHCSQCKSQLPMEVVKKIDIIDELSDMAESTGASVQLISQGSEEGDSLYKAFSGIAGILRYPLDL
jgi:peptide chain release factor subunit 1